MKKLYEANRACLNHLQFFWSISVDGFIVRRESPPECSQMHNNPQEYSTIYSHAKSAFILTRET